MTAGPAVSVDRNSRNPSSCCRNSVEGMPLSHRCDSMCARGSSSTSPLPNRRSGARACCCSTGERSSCCSGFPDCAWRTCGVNRNAPTSNADQHGQRTPQPHRVNLLFMAVPFRPVLPWEVWSSNNMRHACPWKHQLASSCVRRGTATDCLEPDQRPSELQDRAAVPVSTWRQSYLETELDARAPAHPAKTD